MLYAVLQLYHEKATYLFFPFISLISLVYYFHNYPEFGWSVIGCWDMIFLRGTGKLAIGCSLYYFAENYQKELQEAKIAIDFLSLSALLLIIVLLFAQRDYANYAPLLSALVLLGAFTDNSFLCRNIKSNIWITLGGISFEMLLIHGIVKPVVSFAGIGQLPGVVSIPLYLSLVIISAFGLKWINKKLMPVLFTKKDSNSDHQ